MQFSDSNPITVALLYQSPSLHEHLRTALGDAGVRIVYESAIRFLSKEDIHASGASVIVINLDPEYGESDERIEELLLNDSRKVIFNDGEVTSKLSGWDQARWARHLAAKISDSQHLLPARPLGAESIPVHSLPESYSAETVANSLVRSSSIPSRENNDAAIADSLEIPKIEDLSLPADVVTHGILNSDREDADIKLEINFDFHQSDETSGKIQATTATQAAAELIELDAFLAQQARDKNANLPEAPSSTLDELMPELSFAHLVDTELTSLLPSVTVAAKENHDPVNELSLVAFSEEVNESYEKTVRPEPSVLAAQFAELSFELEAMSNETPEEFPVVAPKSAEKNQPFPVQQLDADAPTLENAFDVDAAILEAMALPNVKNSAPENPALKFSPTSDRYNLNTNTRAPRTPGTIQKIWVLCASIGGPDAVREFLSTIPENSPHLFLLAQHMGADFVDLMLDQLAKAIQLEVKMAANESKAIPGQVLIVPLRGRLLLDLDGQMRITSGDEVSPYSPSIDRVLFDAADGFGNRANAIIFSGMANDAIEGAKYLASKGGLVWVQDPETCVVSSMIEGAIEEGIVSFVGSPSALAQKLMADFQ